MGKVNKCDQLRFVNLHLHNVHIMCICFTNIEMILNVQIKITCITLNIVFFLFERLKKNPSAWSHQVPFSPNYTGCRDMEEAYH